MRIACQLNHDPIKQSPQSLAFRQIISVDYVFPNLQLLIGLILLISGGELLVRGASKLAILLRLSPLVVGLTVVAFGTSAPELAVTLQSAWKGTTPLAVGNAVGSNIFNVLFILGLSALIAPLVVARQLIRRDVPLMLAASVGLLLFGLDGQLGRLDGLVLFTILLTYLIWTVRQSKQENALIDRQVDDKPAVPARARIAPFLQPTVILTAGLLLIGFGASWMVSGSVTIARMLGVSELIIGLTIVAVGTSLPEAVTSVVAAAKGEREIAVGNIVGSNIFNILCVLGLGAIASPVGLAIPDDAIWFDIPVMIAITFACWPIFIVGQRVARWEGGLFFAYYIAYLTHVVLEVTNEDLSRLFANFMIWIAIPLTVVVLAIGVWRQFRSRTGN